MTPALATVLAMSLAGASLCVATMVVDVRAVRRGAPDLYPPFGVHAPAAVWLLGGAVAALAAEMLAAVAAFI